MEAHLLLAKKTFVLDNAAKWNRNTWNGKTIRQKVDAHLLLGVIREIITQKVDGVCSYEW